MPAGIMLMGITFNLLNGYKQGEWIFYLAPQDMYTEKLAAQPSIYSRDNLVLHRHGNQLSSQTILSATSESLATRTIICLKKACSNM